MHVEEAWSEIVPKFIRVPMLAYKYRKRIRAWAYRGLLLIGWGRTDVVVVGRPGAGKSVLMERFSGRTGDLNWVPPSVSTSVESAVLVLGEDPLLIRIIPGQDSRERANGLHEALSRHTKLQGIIYVADWGFNPVRNSAVRNDRINRDGIDTIDKLRDINLEAEINDFKNIVQRIKDAQARTRGSFWLLVVVNKADLFFKKIDEAQSYYHPEIPHGFSEALNDLRSGVGKNSFKCEIVPISSWHEDFEWNGDKTLSHLDDVQARALFSNMRDRVNDLSKWWNK